MGFAAYTNWLQAPATTGQVTYTVTGFGYLPKLIILRANGLTTSNGGGFDALMGIGAATSSSNQVTTGVSSLHNQDVGDTGRFTSANSALNVQRGLTTILRADFVSFALDGNDAKFTLSWVTTIEGAHIQFDLFGGDDFEANILLSQMPSADGDQAIAHGLTDAPTALMLCTAFGGLSVQGASNILYGVSDTTSQKSTQAISAFASDISNTSHAWYPSNILKNVGFPFQEATVSAVDGTNITLSWTNPNSNYFWMIAMRGVQAHVGETTIPAAGNLTISGCPFQPAYGMFLSPCGEGSGDDARMMIGAAGSATGSRSMSIGIAEQDNQDTTNARRFIAQDIAVNYSDHAGNIVFTGMVDEFTVDGAEISMSVNPSDGLDYVLGYMFLAEAEADDPDPPTATGLPSRKFTVRPCVRPVMYPCVRPCVGG